jgi:hypothetical protein
MRAVSLNEEQPFPPREVNRGSSDPRQMLSEWCRRLRADDQCAIQNDSSAPKYGEVLRKRRRTSEFDAPDVVKVLTAPICSSAKYGAFW